MTESLHTKGNKALQIVKRSEKAKLPESKHAMNKAPRVKACAKVKDCEQQSTHQKSKHARNTKHKSKTPETECPSHRMQGTKVPNPKLARNKVPKLERNSAQSQSLLETKHLARARECKKQSQRGPSAGVEQSCVEN